MTDVKNRYGIYPTLPQNAEDWRLKSCFNFEKEIEKDITKTSNNLSKMKKKLKNLRIASSTLTGSATAFSIGGTALSATVVGVVVGAPLVGVGILVGAFSLLTLKMEKNVFKEIVKSEKVLSLIYSKLSSMREIINKSLKDNKIDEQEYKYLEYEFNQYTKMREETLAPPSKKEDETKEILEKLLTALKK